MPSALRTIGQVIHDDIHRSLTICNTHEHHKTFRYPRDGLSINCADSLRDQTCYTRTESELFQLPVTEAPVTRCTTALISGLELSTLQYFRRNFCVSAPR